MKTITTYPKITNVKSGLGKTLNVKFENGITKRYDCKPLLEREAFYLLKNDAIFRCVHADSHGYGVIWNDDIDLAESELWLNGKTVEQEK